MGSTDARLRIRHVRDLAQGWLALVLGVVVAWMLSFVVSDDDLERWNGED